MTDPAFERCELCHLYEESGAEAYNRGDYEEAFKYFKTTFDMASRCSQVGDCGARKINNLAVIYDIRKQRGEAYRLYRQAIQTCKSVHPGLAIILNNLAGLYYFMGKFDFSETLYQRAIKILEDQSQTSQEDLQEGLKNYIFLLRRKNGEQEILAMETCMEMIISMMSNVK